MSIYRIRAAHSVFAGLLFSASVFSMTAQAACPAASGGTIEVANGIAATTVCVVNDNNSLIVRSGGSINVGLNAQAISVNGGETSNALDITIEDGAFVTGFMQVHNGASVDGLITIDGEIESVFSVLDIYGTANNINIGQNGAVINTQYNPAIVVRGGGSVGDITNNGLIQGGEYVVAMHLSGDSSGNIINNGTIDGGEGAIDISSDSFGYIQNNGIISHTSDTVDMYGGAISMRHYTNDILQIYNYGMIDGIVWVDNANLFLLGDGSDNAVSHEMRVTGEVFGTANTTVYVGYAEDTADFTLESSMNVGRLIIREDSRLGFTYDTLDAGAVDNQGGILDLGYQTITIGGDYYQAGGQLRLGARDLSDYGRVIVEGEAGFEGDAEIFVDVANNAINFANNDRLLNVVSSESLSIAGLSVASNSVLYDFSYVQEGNNLHLVFALEDDSNNNGGGGENPSGPVQKRADAAGQGAGGAIDFIMANNPGGNFDDVINAFGHLTTDQEVADAVTQTLPVMGGNTTQATLNTMNTTARIVQARQEGNQGISSGDGFVSNGNGWLKSFGSWAKQKSANGYTGFKSDGYGLMAGIDGVVSDNARLGVAVAYAHNTLKGLDAASTQRVKTDTYHATLYGSYDLGSGTELNARIGGGFGKNDGRSIIAFGGANTVAKSDYDSLNFDASIGVGHTMSLAEGTTFTPSARLDYMYVHNKAYTQTGAGGFNQRVNAQTTDQLIPGVEAKLNHNFTDTLGAALNLGVGYDVINERSQITSQFVGGGAAFSTQGAKTSPWVTNAGVGLTMNPGAAVELTARYDAEMRGSNYHNQSVSLKIRAPF